MKKLVSLLLVTLFLAACSGKKLNTGTIVVACSPTPHAEILYEAKELLKKEGYDLEIVEYEDYVQPIEACESGDVDANYFAHIPYINNYNLEKGTNQIVVGKIHYEPFGIYPGLKKSLSEIKDNDVIFIPNDGTNETRALLLLQDNGIVKLKDGVNAESIVTVNDIVSKLNVEIRELEAVQISRVRQEAAFVVLNGNYALAAGLNVSKDAIAYEKTDSLAAKTYVNVIAVKSGNENNEGIKKLVEILKSDSIKDFINNKYDGAVIPFVE